MLALKNLSSVLNDLLCDLVRSDTICHVSELVMRCFSSLSKDEGDDSQD